MQEVPAAYIGEVIEETRHEEDVDVSIMKIIMNMY